METNTSKFEFTHGRKPRGTALWGFEIYFTDGNGRYSSETAFAHGTLSAARNQAWRQIKATVGGAKQPIEAIVLP